jgi:hypothetical protein
MRGISNRRGRTALAALLAGGALVWLPQAAQAAPIVNHPNFASTAGLKLNGDAEPFGDALRMTQSDQESNSSVFTKRRVLRLDRSFTSLFTYYSTDAKDVAGNGYAFVVHGAGKSALGGGGEGLGYGGIRPSVAVEFDFTPDKTVPTGHHVAIVKNGRPNLEPVLADFPAYAFTVHAKVAYNAQRHRISLFAAHDEEPLPQDPLVTRRLNLKALIGARARAGFTASAYVGGSTQELASWKLKQRR